MYVICIYVYICHCQLIDTVMIYCREGNLDILSIQLYVNSLTIMQVWASGHCSVFGEGSSLST